MSEWITPSLTLVLVCVTIYYAWQTRQTVKAMNEANEASNRPVISISLKERDESISFLDFIVVNAGNGLARDISFRVHGENFLVKEVGARKELLKDFRPIKNSIKVLAPKETKRYWFVSVMGRIEEFQKIETQLEITYHNHDRSKQYTDTFSFDFLSLPEYSLGDEPRYKTAKELEKIRKELENISRSIKR